MKIAVVRAGDLSPDHHASWVKLQSGNRQLDSPYFRPEYTAAVGAVRPSAEVGVVEDHAGVAGFFPFERGRFNVAGPIGGHMTDFQGCIAGAERDLDPTAVLGGCRLNAWDFDHQLASQAMFAPFAVVQTRSPFIDTAAGFDAYVASRRLDGSQNVPQLRRKERGLAKSLGPVRLEVDTTDPAVFTQTLAWKSAQYRATGVRDIFTTQPWTLELLTRIQQHRDRAFAGLVSALYAGDRLVAGHVGMRSDTVWHYWFPAHDPAAAAFSPGSILLLKMIERAPAMGITRIDLGKGEMRYKSRFMSGAIPLIEGRLELPSAVTTYRRAARRLYQWGRMTPPARLLRRLRHGAS